MKPRRPGPTTTCWSSAPTISFWRLRVIVCHCSRSSWALPRCGVSCVVRLIAARRRLGRGRGVCRSGHAPYPLAPADLALGPQLGQLVELFLGALHLGLPFLAGGISRDAAVQGFRKLGRVEPVQDGLDDVLLERLGHDRHLAAAAEVRPAGADVAASAIVARARDELAAAVVAAKQPRAAGSGGRCGWCAGRGRSASRAGAGLRRGDDRRPLRRRDDLAMVVALATDPPRDEDALERLRLPGRAGDGRDATLVQVEAEGAQRIARPARAWRTRG